MSRLILLIVIVMLASEAVQSTTIELPVSQKTLTKVNLSIKYLQRALEKFSTIWQNKFVIFKRVQLTKFYLEVLRNELKQYNNVVNGNGNSVDGNKNIVIGNVNNVQGSNNWVFVSKFSGEINGDLILGKWRVELDKSPLIIINPRFAISFINEDRNRPLITQFAQKNRQLCRWDKWARPDNKKINQFWSGFNGYLEWKQNILGNFIGGISHITNGILGGIFRRK